MRKYKAVVYSGERLNDRQTCWYFRVYNPEGELVALDSTGNWRVIYDNALNLARTLGELEIRGFEIKQPGWVKDL